MCLNENYEIYCSKFKSMALEKDQNFSIGNYCNDSEYNYINNTNCFIYYKPFNMFKYDYNF